MGYTVHIFQYIPMAVLFGVFMYMGVCAMSDLQVSNPAMGMHM